MKNYYATILVVDDDPNDRHLIELALRHNGVTSPIIIVMMGAMRSLT
jgi:CheY-like chemotaxis protein